MSDHRNAPTLGSKAFRWAMLAALCGFLVACGGGGGGGVSIAVDGNLRVALTDAPSCGYDHVYITVEKVRVHQSTTAADGDSGWKELVVSPARRIDLLSLTNGVLEELGTTPLSAGSYSQVRLVLAGNSAASPLANAVQPTGGALVALSTPSAQQSGLKLQSHFEVAAGQTADIVLDFDACKSVVKRGNSGQYNLKPVVSVLQRVVNSIEGYVTTTYVLGSTTVSAQQNGVTVRATVPDATGKFSLPYLGTGTYTVVVASEGRSTAVMTAVPVTAATRTAINSTATAIASPASVMRSITGTVSMSGTPPTMLTDAKVRAQQTVSGIAIELANIPVDADLASYSLRLPAAAPVRSAYSATLVPVFTADIASGAGIYAVQATTAAGATQQKTVDVSAADGTAVFTFGP